MFWARAMPESCIWRVTISAVSLRCAAIVPLAQAARGGDKEFAAVKVFRCPMTKDAFPGAPNRADWIQLQSEVRNPWFGAEMLDCGSEVKP